ncbi:MAG TPA: alpha-amylase family glycosyl hydrolase [Chthoniobacterales bacterium]
MISSVLGSDGASIDFSISRDRLLIDYRCGEVRGARTIFVAVRSGSAVGSAVVPFSENFEGSTVFLPFQADRLFVIQWNGASVSIFARTWENWRWSEAQVAPNDITATIEGSCCKVAVELASIESEEKISLAAYAKDFSHGKSWGWFFGCSASSVPAGEGERYLPHYLELDRRAQTFKTRARLSIERERLRIYQLFVRLFGNTNETRQPHGTLAENGVGKFNDIHEAALGAIQQMGFSHIWLTGVLQQASGTDYSEIGQPASDADLLKGIAGSPYAIADYFDVCADYAVEPKNRLTEFKALLDRVHAQGLQALIDFIPNHVARCYHSDIKPEINFGRHDNRTVFFDPKNNFFYLPPNDDGPPLQLPTAGTKPHCDGCIAEEMEHGRVTGNNVVSWKPSLNDWYETVKLNYGFDFTDPAKNVREYPNARTPEKAIPDTWVKMDEVISYWQSLGVDGFRCDMAHMEPPEFWKWLIARARGRAPAVVFVAEAYDNDPAKVPGSDPLLAQLAGGCGNVKFDLLDAGFDGVYDDPSYRVLKGIYEGGRWANDLDDTARDPFISDNALRYAENHDEVRLAAPNEWGGVGMEAGRAVSAILYGLSRGPLLLYNGQEVGEPAAGAEGFGGDDARTTIFDYWSMPEMVRWVNGHQYDGGKLAPEQKALREFYGRLVRLNGEPAFRDGGFYSLNPANRDNPRFERLGEEAASGHWLYAFWRCDLSSEQRFLVVANLHPTDTLRQVLIVSPPPALEFLALDSAVARMLFVDRLVSDSIFESTIAAVEIAEIAPLSALYLECLPNEAVADRAAGPGHDRGAPCVRDVQLPSS